MPNPYDMTTGDIEAEMSALWDDLAQVPDDEYAGAENEARRDRLHSLSAALHWKRQAEPAPQ